ncbi:unnamed protein product, partial [Oppiella nova]
MVAYYISKRYSLLELDYWQNQGVRTGKVSQWARYTKQWYDWEQELCRKNGKLFGIYETTKPVLYLSDPELIREVLVKDFHDFRTGADPLSDNM